MSYDDVTNAIAEDRRKRREAERAQQRARVANARKAAEQARAADPSDPFAGRRAATQVLTGVAGADDFGKNQRA